MAIISSEEFMSSLQTFIGERTDDEAITFLENARDTLADKDNTDNEDWKKRYEDNDAAWRKRYIDTFYGAPVDTTVEKPTEQEDNAPKTFKDLFKEG